MTWDDNMRRTTARKSKAELAQRIFKCEFISGGNFEVRAKRVKIENYTYLLRLPIYNGTDATHKTKIIPPLHCTNITFALIFFFFLFFLFFSFSGYSVEIPQLYGIFSICARSDAAHIYPKKKYGDFKMGDALCTDREYLMIILFDRERVYLMQTTRCFYHYLSLWCSRSFWIKQCTLTAQSSQLRIYKRKKKEKTRREAKRGFRLHSQTNNR